MYTVAVILSQTVYITHLPFFLTAPHPPPPVATWNGDYNPDAVCLNGTKMGEAVACIISEFLAYIFWLYVAGYVGAGDPLNELPMAMNEIVTWKMLTFTPLVGTGAVRSVLRLNWNACLLDVRVGFAISMWAYPTCVGPDPEGRGPAE